MRLPRRLWPWTREQWLERGLLTLFAGVMLFHFSRRAAAPKELEFLFYNDHFRHLRYAWEATTNGPFIYLKNTADLKVIGDLRAYGWPNITYLYPPGALLLYAPAAQLAFRGIVSFDVAANLMIFVFAMAGAFSAIRIWRQGALLTGSFEGSVLWFGIGLIFGMMAVAWALRGQYDSVPIALLVLAGAPQNTRSRRLVLLGLAFVLKFQALVCLPFFALDLLGALRERRLYKPAVLIASALTAVSLASAVYLGASGRLTLAKQTPFHFEGFPKDRVTFACTLFTVVFALAAMLRGRFAAALSALWVFAAFASLSVLQAWYILYFFGPIFLVDRRSQPWFGIWAVGVIYFMHWWPDVYHAVYGLFVLNPLL